MWLLYFSSSIIIFSYILEYYWWLTNHTIFQCWSLVVTYCNNSNRKTHLQIKIRKHPSVTRKLYFYPKTGFYFRTSEDGAGWHLIPCRISPRSEFFPRAHKNWHIMWGINLGLDWPPLARGSKFHTIHTPTKAASLPPLEQWKIWTSRLRRNNINYSSR